MSKQITIAIIAVVVLALIGGFAFMQMRKTPPAANEQPVAEQNVPSPTPQDSSMKSTIKSLIASGKTVSCEVSMDQGIKGTTYVSGNKVRTDVTVKVADKEMMTHMIGDGEYMYSWSDGVSQGTKFKIDQNAPKPSGSPSGQTQTTDINKEMDFKCSPWTADNSKFTLPADVKFSDMSEVINGMMKGKSSAAPKMDKSICDQIADATSKAACLKALGN